MKPTQCSRQEADEKPCWIAEPVPKGTGVVSSACPEIGGRVAAQRSWLGAECEVDQHSFLSALLNLPVSDRPYPGRKAGRSLPSTADPLGHRFPNLLKMSFDLCQLLSRDRA